MKKRKGGTNRSIYLFASEVAFIDAYDIDLQGSVHEMLDIMQRLNDGETQDKLIKDFEAGVKRDREMFMASLDTYAVGRVVDQVKYLKRRRGIAEIHRALEGVMGPPPWTALGFRERVNDFHRKTLSDIGVSPDELEGYSRVRGFLEDSPMDVLEYSAPMLPETTKTVDSEVERKDALVKIERQVSNFIERTPKKEHEELRKTLAGKAHISKACEKAGLSFDDLWDELTAPNEKVK